MRELQLTPSLTFFKGTAEIYREMQLNCSHYIGEKTKTSQGHAYKWESTVVPQDLIAIPLLFGPFESGRRSIFRKKFLYKLTEKDSTIINTHLSTSDTKHSSFCLNGNNINNNNNNNNNNQGLTFNPCSCMSSLGLPPQNVSLASFLPIKLNSNDTPSHKVSLSCSFSTVALGCLVYTVDAL